MNIPDMNESQNNGKTIEADKTGQALYESLYQQYIKKKLEMEKISQKLCFAATVLMAAVVIATNVFILTNSTNSVVKVLSSICTFVSSISCGYTIKGAIDKLGKIKELEKIDMKTAIEKFEQSR